MGFVQAGSGSAVPGRLDSGFEEVAAKWGCLDFVLHSIGYARSDDLHGRLIECSAEGFAYAMQVSAQSFLRMAKLAEPLMTDGGCLLAFTFQGAQKVMPHYGVMGPVKAGLETAVKYMAAELGAQRIRVNAISRWRLVRLRAWVKQSIRRLSTDSSLRTASARWPPSW